MLAMKFEPDLEYLKRWFSAELASGYGLDQCIKIADIVCQGKRYSDEDKIDFLSRKAATLYNRGRENASLARIALSMTWRAL